MKGVERHSACNSPQWSSMLKAAGICTFCAATFCSSGCLFHKSPRLFSPPPLAQVQAPPPAPPPILEFPSLELTASLEPPQLPAPIFPDLAPPPRPAPPPAKRPPVATTPKPPAATPETPAPPKLGQILPVEQAREYTRTLDESLDRVKKALDTLARRTLSSEQADTVERIRTFQKQAEQAREQDLVTAVSLARRADLLAKDLVERLP